MMPFFYHLYHLCIFEGEILGVPKEQIPEIQVHGDSSLVQIVNLQLELESCLHVWTAAVEHLSGLGIAGWPQAAGALQGPHVT